MKKLVTFAISLLFSFLLIEISYRYQWIDFYSSELKSLNPTINQKGEKTILFFGDSFSAQQKGYIEQLRLEFPTYNLINTAIPGTGVYETSYILKKRVEKYHPDMIVFQLYIGNDLLDIRHPINWKELNLLRNTYWWLSDQVHILRFLNYKLGQLSAFVSGDLDESYNTKTNQPFSIKSYAPRTKMYIKADSMYISNSILLEGNRKRDFDFLIQRLTELITSYDKTIKTAILIVPHCTQVNSFYNTNYQKLGAALPDFKSSDTYPFVEKLENSLNKSSNVAIWNPLAVMQQNDTIDKRLYFTNDPHMTQEGNQVLTAYLKTCLSN